MKRNREYCASGVAIKWSRKKNPPLMDPWEVDLLIKYARKCKVHFVEIGTHKGGSASLISKYLPPNVNLTTIDTFEKPPRGSAPPENRPPKYDEAKETIEQQGDISKVEIIKGNSWEVARTWDKKIDIVFIDGDHRYNAVKKDFDSWEPHVTKDGYILIHDIDLKGVEKAYREIVRKPGFLLEERVGTLAVLKRKTKKKNMKNVVVGESRTSGKGVFSARNFKKDEEILEIDDSHVITDPSTLTKEQYEFEVDVGNGKIVLMQAPERYINHSCDPNIYVKTVNHVRKIFTMRDILKGEEIVWDYSINGYNEGTFKCHCGSQNCRGIYQGNFFKLPKNLQKKYLPYLDDWFLEQFKEKINSLRHSE